MKFIATLNEAFEFITPDEARGACLITDPRLPDNPIVFVSAGFEQRSGYDRAELLGCNCRVLQGVDTEAEEVARIRQALWEMEPLSAVLTNYRKDGASFRNAFSIRPCFGPAGDLRSFVSIHGEAEDFDVPATVRSRRWGAALRGMHARLSMPAVSASNRQ